MSLYPQFDEVWSSMKVGDSIDYHELYMAATGKKTVISMTDAERSTTSAFLSHKVSTGEAQKERKNGERRNRYFRMTVEKKTIKRRTNSRGKKSGEDLSFAQVGQSIVSLIHKLETKNRELRDEKIQISNELKDAVEAKRQITDLYDKAQKRILELNQEKGSGRGSINLHELQSLVS